MAGKRQSGTVGDRVQFVLLDTIVPIERDYIDDYRLLVREEFRMPYTNTTSYPTAEVGVQRKNLLGSWKPTVCLEGCSPKRLHSN